MREISAEDVIFKSRFESFYRATEEAKRKADLQALKNYYWYTKDSLNIAFGIREGLRKIMGADETIEWYPVQVQNDVPRIIKRLALCYMKPAIRTYENISDEHKAIVESNLDVWLKECDRQATLLNTILVRPIYNRRKQKLDYQILGRQFANVITYDDDAHEAKEVSYTIAASIAGVEQEVTVYWTDNEVWAEDTRKIDVTRFLPEMFPSGRVNPYGRIPFVTLRLEQSNDFWGDGLSDYVNLCESNSMLLTSAYVKQWLTFGYGIAKNLNLEDNLKIRPNQLISVDVADFNRPEPDLKFITPNHETKGDTDYISYSRKTALNSFGMSASSLSTDTNQLSGYAKTIDNIEIQDANNDKISIYEVFERELFEMQKLELRANGIPVNESAAIVNVLHQTYEMPKSESEIWLSREKEYQYDMSSAIDWLMQDNPSMTADDAKQILVNNKKFKTDLEVESRGMSIIERLRSARP